MGVGGVTLSWLVRFPPPPPPTRTNGKAALILQALCTCKISALNEDYRSGMLPEMDCFEFP
jgi:hypothetical protein